jgi:2-dehydro-3-deoxyphosphogluconate aldolase/(4S)-4-hydroxy-2-oxoglutarate aldolase
MPSSRLDSVRTIEALGAIAVVRLDDGAKLKPVVAALIEGDVRAIEVTMTIPGALEAMSALQRIGDGRSLLGAGTVLDPETARLAILAGARFIVAPTLCPAVVAMCARYDVAAIPGAYTPTEILAAWEAGADLVKVFPAGSLGPEYIKALLDPLPQLRLLPTGGVSADNAAAFLGAGAVAVGVGGRLLEREAIARGDYARITDSARRLTSAVRAARDRSP